VSSAIYCKIKLPILTAVCVAKLLMFFHFYEHTWDWSAICISHFSFNNCLNPWLNSILFNKLLNTSFPFKYEWSCFFVIIWNSFVKNWRNERLYLRRWCCKCYSRSGDRTIFWWITCRYFECVLRLRSKTYISVIIDIVFHYFNWDIFTSYHFIYFIVCYFVIICGTTPAEFYCSRGKFIDD